MKPCTTTLVSLFTHTLAVVLMARAAVGAAPATRAVVATALLNMVAVVASGGGARRSCRAEAAVLTVDWV